VCDRTSSHHHGSLFFWVWLTHLIKYFELVLTPLLLLTGQRVTFWHVYHRIVALLCTWLALENGDSFQWMLAAVNTLALLPSAVYSLQRLANRRAIIMWRPLIDLVFYAQFALNVAVLGWWALVQSSSGGACTGEWWGFGILAFYALHLFVVHRTHWSDDVPPDPPLGVGAVDAGKKND